MKKYILTALFFSMILVCQGQTKKYMGMNSAYKTGLNQDEKEIVSLFSNYFEAIALRKDTKPFFLKNKDGFYHDFPGAGTYECMYSSFNRKSDYYQPTLLNLDYRDSTNVATLAFGHQSEDGFAEFSSVLTLNFEKSGDKYLLKDPLYHNTRNWKNRQLGSIGYVYNPAVSFNEAEANRMISREKEIISFFGIEAVPIKYFVFENYPQIQKTRGFEYNPKVYQYNFNACISDVYNNMIFTGNNSFYHAHELTHIYVSKKYKTASYHNFWSEGIATYLGGSQSKDLSWHLAKVKKYAKENPTKSFNDLLSFSQEYSYEDLTNLDYALGGLFCKLIYEKQGIKGIDAVFNSGDSDTVVYEIIEKTLGIKKENLNEFVRKELEKY